MVTTVGVGVVRVGPMLDILVVVGRTLMVGMGVVALAVKVGGREVEDTGVPVGGGVEVLVGSEVDMGVEAWVGEREGVLVGEEEEGVEEVLTLPVAVLVGELLLLSVLVDPSLEELLTTLTEGIRLLDWVGSSETLLQCNLLHKTTKTSSLSTSIFALSCARCKK